MISKSSMRAPRASASFADHPPQLTPLLHRHTIRSDMPTILEEYVASHHASLKLHQESSRVFPGGVTHDTRRLAPFPVYMTRSEGPRKWDVDDNEYIDYVMGHGALIQGGVQGLAYGTSSLIRVLFGIEPDGDRWVDEPWTLPHREVETALHSRAAALFRQAMLNNGVDPMSGCLFIVSAVHSDGDIDATVEAFDRSLRSLRAEGLL